MWKETLSKLANALRGVEAAARDRAAAAVSKLRAREPGDGEDRAVPSLVTVRLAGDAATPPDCVAPLRTGFIACVAVLIGLGSWSLVASISGTVIANGRVVVEGKVQSIQHPDGGVISEILVRDGQRVHKGEVLLRLESAQLESEVAILNGRLRDALARRARLEAERDGNGLRTASAATAAGQGNGADQALQAEAGLLETRRASLFSRLKRVVLRAPVGGTVNTVTVTAVGDAIRPAETVMEIVQDREDPEGQEPMVEAAVDPLDIDRLYEGQAARVTLSAPDVRAAPALNGVLARVSAAAVEDPQTRQRHYRVKVRIPADEIGRLESARLEPGMPAQVVFRTGSRSPVSDFLGPLFGRADRVPADRAPNAR